MTSSFTIFFLPLSDFLLIDGKKICAVLLFRFFALPCPSEVISADDFLLPGVPCLLTSLGRYDDLPSIRPSFFSRSASSCLPQTGVTWPLLIPGRLFSSGVTPYPLADLSPPSFIVLKVGHRSLGWHPTSIRLFPASSSLKAPVTPFS